MKKILFFASILLSFSGMVNASSIQGLDGYACGKCIMKLPENLFGRRYFIANEGLYKDDSNEFIGFGNVEIALRGAGIRDFKIDYSESNGEGIRFDVITDNPMKKMIPSILAEVKGVAVDNPVSYEIDGIPTRVISDCKQKAYDMALSELKASRLVKGYDVTIDKYVEPVYREDLKSAELTVCLKSVRVEGEAIEPEVVSEADAEKESDADTETEEDSSDTESEE